MPPHAVSTWPAASGCVLGRTVTSNGKWAAHRMNCCDFSHCTCNETAFFVPFFRATGGTGRAVVSQDSKRIRGSNQEPWATARAPAGSCFCLRRKPMCVTWSLQVWQQKAFWKACHIHVISSHPFEQRQKKPSFSPFPDLWLLFPSIFPVPGKGVPWLLSLQMPVFLVVLECWETLGQFCCS